MKYDFLIIGLPRSGTHMLGTALNSHPDIQCRNEDEQPLYGPCTGRVFTRLDNLPAAEKYIVITRPWIERVASWHSTGTSHLCKPGLPNVLAGRNDSLPKDDHKLIAFAMKHHAYRISYDEVTCGSDMRQIPDRIAVEICDYLDVIYRPLVPRTYKPNT